MKVFFLPLKSHRIDGMLPSLTGLSLWIERRRDSFRSYVVSFVFHAFLLACLAIWVFPGLSLSKNTPDHTALSVVTGMDERELLELLNSGLVQEFPHLQNLQPNSIVATDTFVSSPTRVSYKVSMRGLEPAAAYATLSGSGKLGSVDLSEQLNNQPDPATSRRDRNSSVMRRSVVDPSRVGQGHSVAATTDFIFGRIRETLAQGNTLVIWLLDSSISMQRQHQMLADRLAQFLTQLQQTDGSDEHVLHHGVVAFGQRPRQLVALTPKPALVLSAIRQVPIDNTGLENTFGAVGWCVQEYLERNSKNRKKQVMITVWTDESGDDIGRLENTVRTCIGRHVSVSVVGPSAVLGAARGYHVYHHPVDGRDYYLPVTRGPDSGFPQRLRLPHWFRLVPESWDEGFRGPWQGSLPAWYGGSDLESLVSGFAPYGLARLTQQTGGLYIIYDRPADRAPFSIDDLRPYLPDYRSLPEIEHDLKDNTFRRSILAAVRMTYANVDLRPPRMDFTNSALNGQAFVAFLQSQLATQTSNVAVASQIVETALSKFGKDGLEEGYGKEESPRWRAWYDLTRGRLLAVSVRLREYSVLASRLAQGNGLATTTNSVDIEPSRVIVSGSETEWRASEAYRLLSRCIESNRDTPWMYLAERELQNPLGLTVIQRSLPPPRPVVVPGPRPAAPQRPALPRL